MKITPALALCALTAVPAYTQQLSVGVEMRRDRIDYHFDNPSTFDTPDLVPHFFEQHYRVDSPWATTVIAYGRWCTSVAAALPRTTTADDFDTFFDPGATWVSGTTGPARARSFAVEQSRRVGRVVLAYRFRFDAFDFGVGHKTVTRNGELISTSDVTSPEMTRSQLHQLVIAMPYSHAFGARWTLTGQLEALPVILGSLAVQLPQKYPGMTLRYLGGAVGAGGRLGASREAGLWRIAVDADAAGAWRLRQSAAVKLDALGLSVTIGRRW